MAHGVEHNQEIASALLPKLESTFQNDHKDIAASLLRVAEGYEEFGFRIFVLDRNSQTVIMDSADLTTAVLPFKQSWMDNAVGLDGTELSLMKDSGAVLALDDNKHPTLIWLQEIGISEPGRWVLGVAKDQNILTDFLILQKCIQ
ncbi:MAG: hypothetical protein HN504_01040 [Candidatus Nitrosopelagicus sp.]|nr:hypothetical protein [Candidatus Nitrosopelagicus sp.]